MICLFFNMCQVKNQEKNKRRIHRTLMFGTIKKVVSLPWWNSHNRLLRLSVQSKKTKTCITAGVTLHAVEDWPPDLLIFLLCISLLIIFTSARIMNFWRIIIWCDWWSGAMHRCKIKRDRAPLMHWLAKANISCLTFTLSNIFMVNSCSKNFCICPMLC